MKAIIAIALLLLSFPGCQKKAASTSSAADRQLPPKPAAKESTGTQPQLSYADVVERVAPGVVTIRAARRVRAPRQIPFSDDPLFRQFFGELFPQERRQRPSVQLALGSGVIVAKDGTILTNFHVIDGAEQIKVELTNHRVLDAKVIGSDTPSD